MQSSCDNEEECVLVFLASFGRTLLCARMAKSKEVAETAEKNDRSSDFSRNNENEENCVVLRDRLFDNELSVVTETEWTLLPEGATTKCVRVCYALWGSQRRIRDPGTEDQELSRTTNSRILERSRVAEDRPARNAQVRRMQS